MEKESCPPELAWEYKQGVKEYIQSETSADPYYALVTGALHGAPADYTQTQPFVDEIIRRGAREFTDPVKNAKFLNKMIKGKRYQFSRQRAPVLAELSKCFLNRLDRGDDRRAAATYCTLKGARGVGRKGQNLMREYLGDDEAVAVDRHVFNYLTLYRGWKSPVKPTWGSHGMRVTDAEIQEAAEKEIRRIASECGKSPADVQVAAWLKGACDVRLKTHKRGKRPWLYLGPDFAVNCRERFYATPELVPIRIRRKERKERPPSGVRPFF